MEGNPAELLIEQIPFPAILTGTDGEPAAINEGMRSLSNLTLSQMQYMYRIGSFQIRKTGSGVEYMLMLYDKEIRLNVRKDITDNGFRLLLFEDARQTVFKRDANFTFESIVGSSAAFVEAIGKCKQCCGMGGYVFLHGESSTGKETLAKCIHNGGAFPERPFFRIRDNQEFTDHLGIRTERQILESPGTLYIDEFANFNHHNQDILFSLLRSCVGTDSKIICASSADISHLMQRGELHRNLFYQLSAVRVRIPALRQRKEDIPLLANYFLKQIGSRLGRDLSADDGLITLMKEYSWPGNMQEMEGFLYRAAAGSRRTDGRITAEHFQKLVPFSAGGRSFEQFSLKQMEREMIVRALNRFGNAPGGKMEAAKALGISVATLYRKIGEYEIGSIRLYDE